MLISHCTYLDGSFIVLQMKYKQQKIEGNDRERLNKLLDRKIDYKWKYWHDKAEKDNYSVSADDNNNTITIPLKKDEATKMHACLSMKMIRLYCVDSIKKTVLRLKMKNRFKRSRNTSILSY
jgi:hypothetical protein